MDVIEILAIKVAAALRTPAVAPPVPLVLPPVPPTPVQQLLAAKAESDRRNWRGKNRILREAILAEPSAFMIDSEARGIVGLTHLPSRFQIHMPRTALPTVKLQRWRPPVKSSDGQ